LQNSIYSNYFQDNLDADLEGIFIGSVAAHKVLEQSSCLSTTWCFFLIVSISCFSNLVKPLVFSTHLILQWITKFREKD